MSSQFYANLSKMSGANFFSELSQSINQDNKQKPRNLIMANKQITPGDGQGISQQAASQSTNYQTKRLQNNAPNMSLNTNMNQQQHHHGNHFMQKNNSTSHNFHLNQNMGNHTTTHNNQQQVNVQYGGPQTNNYHVQQQQPQTSLVFNHPTKKQQKSHSPPQNNNNLVQFNTNKNKIGQGVNQPGTVGSSTSNQGGAGGSGKELLNQNRFQQQINMYMLQKSGGNTTNQSAKHTPSNSNHTSQKLTKQTPQSQTTNQVSSNPRKNQYTSNSSQFAQNKPAGHNLNLGVLTSNHQHIHTSSNSQSPKLFQSGKYSHVSNREQTAKLSTQYVHTQHVNQNSAGNIPATRYGSNKSSGGGSSVGSSNHLQNQHLQNSGGNGTQQINFMPMGGGVTGSLYNKQKNQSNAYNSKAGSSNQMSPKIPYASNNQKQGSYGIVSHKQSHSGKLQQVKGGNGSTTSSGGIVSRATNNYNKMTGNSGNSAQQNSQSSKSKTSSGANYQQQYPTNTNASTANNPTQRKQSHESHNSMNSSSIQNNSSGFVIGSNSGGSSMFKPQQFSSNQQSSHQAYLQGNNGGHSSTKSTNSPVYNNQKHRPQYQNQNLVQSQVIVGQPENKYSKQTSNRVRMVQGGQHSQQVDHQSQYMAQQEYSSPSTQVQQKKISNNMIQNLPNSNVTSTIKTPNEMSDTSQSLAQNIRDVKVFAFKASSSSQNQGQRSVKSEQHFQHNDLMKKIQIIKENQQQSSHGSVIINGSSQPSNISKQNQIHGNVMQQQAMFHMQNNQTTKNNSSVRTNHSSENGVGSGVMNSSGQQVRVNSIDHKNNLYPSSQQQDSGYNFYPKQNQVVTSKDDVVNNGSQNMSSQNSQAWNNRQQQNNSQGGQLSRPASGSGANITSSNNSNQGQTLSKNIQSIRSTSKLQIGQQQQLQQQNQRQPNHQVVYSNNPKEQIISHITKYLKKNGGSSSNNPQSLQASQNFKQDNYQSSVLPQNQDYNNENLQNYSTNSDQVNQEILKNLRDFLQYLEDKGIINPNSLQENKEEMKALIKDILKLDLNKFSKPRNNSQNNHQLHAQQQNNKSGSGSHAQVPYQKRKVNASPDVSNQANSRMHYGGKQQPFIIQSQQPLPNENMFKQRHNSATGGNPPTLYSKQPSVSQKSNGEQINSSKKQSNLQVPTSGSNTQRQPQQPSSSNQQEDSNGKKQSISNNQQVVGPTIQLMINTNVNNYCITPQQQEQQNQMNDQQKQIFKNRRASDSNLIIQQQQHQNNQKQQSQQQQQVKQSSGQNQAQQPKSLSTSRKISQHENHGPSGLQTNKNSQSNQNLLNQKDHSDKVSHNKQGSGSNGQGDYLTIQQVSENNAKYIKNKNQQTLEKNVVLNDEIVTEQEKLIKYIRSYCKKYRQIPPTTLEFYKFVKLIGKGAFGKVTLGIHKLTGKYVAIKTIDKQYMKDDYSRRKVFQEVYILKKIRHSCVIRLLEVFESQKHFLMVMEYSGGGDLLQYVKARRRLDEQTSKAIFKQILYGLGHCHCRSVLHRDIKLDNILMDGEGGVKLCDFGVSRLLKREQVIKEQCGTPAYLAPEIIVDQGYQGFHADIWSLGVLLYAMLQGTVPFKANNIADLHKLILAGKFEYPHPKISEDAKDLINKMLVLTPEHRITVPDMLNHPWILKLDGLDNDIDEEHELKVGATFFREECMSGIIGGAQNMEPGNINYVNVENLYYRHQPVKETYGSAIEPTSKTEPTQDISKMSYSDYCALTEDFMTYRIDDEAMEIVEKYGYPRKLVIESINKGDINHATASYYLLIHSLADSEQ